MPAVQVQPAFLTHPDEEKLLDDPEGRRRVAEAIADGIAAFFAAPVPTPTPTAAEARTS
jgi:N-acetylmuramoyl-L-alanine amidase